ncbi:hypothetical protein EZV62_003184 [Acer yangbiense]|uniref:Uncharacterized protein n=1 Tax=Acer yangbiense TaxID=1000413 RepID=A0A5C7IGV0_9ROSI|nr:hypothetical protein EZV62_003184 [Acer yangbiense]
MSCSRAEHKMIEYLNPLQLFRESMKRDYYNPVFLAFSFRDEYASVAIAKDFLCHADPHSKLPRDETLFDRLLNIIHSVQNDPNSAWDRSPFWSFFWQQIKFPKEYSELHKRLELFVAVKMLQNFVTIDLGEKVVETFFGVLEKALKDRFTGPFVEGSSGSAGKFFGGCACQFFGGGFVSGRLVNVEMIEYLNPLQLFRESMKRDYYNPVFLAFSFRDEYASVAIAKDFLCHADPHSKLPRDETLFDRLLNIIHSVQNDPNSAWDRSPFWSFFWQQIKFPKEYSELHKRLELFVAVKMLQAFKIIFALYIWIMTRRGRISGNGPNQFSN